MSVAINRLTGARVVLEAYEAGEFYSITAADAWRKGFEVEQRTAAFFEWADGFAIGNLGTGEIEVLIPAGTYVDVFFLDPATGEIKGA
jgi:hypothetical protein